MSCQYGWEWGAMWSVQKDNLHIPLPRPAPEEVTPVSQPGESTICKAEFYGLYVNAQLVQSWMPWVVIWWLKGSLYFITQILPLLNQAAPQIVGCWPAMICLQSGFWSSWQNLLSKIWPTDHTIDFFFEYGFWSEIFSI